MDKSPEKSDSEVDAATYVVAPKNPLEKGKREAEDAIGDEVLNAKRQKLEESAVQAETKVTTSTKNGHVESELGDKGSGLEEYTTAAKKELAVTATSNKSESPSKFETSSEAVPKKADTTVTTEGLVAAVKKTHKSNESSDSSSQDQTSLDEDTAAPNNAPTTPNAKKVVVSMQKEDESSSSEFGCDDGTSTDKNVATAEKAPAVPTNEGLVTATKNKDESSSDVGRAGEDDVTAKSSSAVVAKKNNLSNEEPDLDNPKTPVTPKEQITGSKTLFVGNLSFAVEQEDVEHFFKAAGEVVNIRFGMNSDETFRGFGYVEFASAEAAEKALHELNGKELLRRPVRLDIAKERRSCALYSGSNDSQLIQKGGRGQGQMIFDRFNKFDKDQIGSSQIEHFGSSGGITRVPILKDQDGAVKSNDTEPSQMGRRDQGQRIFVRGFNKSDDEDLIRSFLEEQFGSCGEITRVSVPLDQDGAVKGIALIEFKDNDAFNQALKLDGSKFGGSALSVEEARPRPGIGGSGRGRRCGWRSGGWDFGGRSSWRSGGGDFGGRSSWRSGGGGDFAGRSSWRSGGADFGGNSWRSGGWDSSGRSSRDFSWSKNYFSYEVDAATYVVAPKNPLEKGKREEEDAIEDEVLNAKRQRMEESTVQAETKATASAKNGQVDSELGDKGNGLEEYTTTAKKEPAVTATSDTNEGLVTATKNKDESSSDVGSAGEDDVTAKSSSAAVAKKKNLSNEEPELDNPKTPVTPKEQITGSKTLFVGNLSFAVEQEDVEHFFKAAGEVVNIRFGMNSDETFRGFGYVEFASAEAAEKALHELNGKELLRRPVRLDIAKERRLYAPYSGNDSQLIQKGGRGQGQIIFDHGFNKFDEDQIGSSLIGRFGSSGEITRVSIPKDQDGAVKSNDTEASQIGRRDQGQTIFVRGFSKFDGVDPIRSSLEEHFGSCGEITGVSIPMDQDGAVKGIALIEFKDNDAFNRALKLNGSKFGGSALSVEEARPKRDIGGSVHGRGRGWRSGGSDFGGRSSWRSGGRDFGGISWRSGGWDSSGSSVSRDFSWSKNYFSYEADAATNIVAPKKPSEKGKREAEDAIEDKVLNAKRQKLEESTVQAATKVTTSAKNGHEDSELGDKGSGLEEYLTAAKKEPAVTEGLVAAVKKTDKSNESSDSSSQDQTSLDEDIATKNKDESCTDVGSADEDGVAAAKNGSVAVAKKKNVSNEEPELDNPKTPVTQKEQKTGSKTLYVGNLSFAVQQKDVEHFFKAAGEVVNIRFVMNSDGTFRGFGYVEFASAEAAEKALHELNGKELLRRPVRLDIAKERRSFAPYSGNDSHFIQKGGRGQGQKVFDHGFNKLDENQIGSSLVKRFGSSGEITRVPILKDQDGSIKSNDTEPSRMGWRDQGQRIFVRGFNKFDGEDQIRSSVEEHFGSCGEITRVSIPLDQDGAVRGIAVIEFKDNDAFNQALRLDGSKFGGSALSVEEARPRRDTGGRGRGWRSGGWDFGGRSSWRGGGEDFGGNSWRSGGGDFGGRSSSWRRGGRDSGGRSGSRDFSWRRPPCGGGWGR
ncbi:hypothetical protein ACS0TY_011365 [Phlomoides rotata]